MKKAVVAIIGVIIIIIVAFKYIPFGNKSYTNSSIVSSLTVPKFSNFKEECCMYAITFESFRSVRSLKYELDHIMKQYDQKACDGGIHYYDKKNHITISEYGVEHGFPMNRFYIVYDKGNTLEDCNNHE